MIRYSQLLLTAAIFLTSATAPVFAATSGFVDVFVDEAAKNCNDSVMVVESTWSYTTDDNDGKDLVGIVIYDGSGNVLATDWQGTTPGEKFLRLTAIGGKYSHIEINSRPLTVDLYDLQDVPLSGGNSSLDSNAFLAQSPPLLERMVYDPADDIASCASVPLAANLEAEDIVLHYRRLAIGIPMMLLVVVLWPMRQYRQHLGKTS